MQIFFLDMCSNLIWCMKGPAHARSVPSQRRRKSAHTRRPPPPRKINRTRPRRPVAQKYTTANLHMITGTPRIFAKDPRTRKSTSVVRPGGPAKRSPHASPGRRPRARKMPAHVPSARPPRKSICIRHRRRPGWERVRIYIWRKITTW